jgi:DNA repair protein RecO (recombination protein O)
VRAKAVQKSQAKLKGHLELFLHSHLLVARGKNLDIVTGAETINNFSFLHKNLSSLVSAYYFSELMDKLISGPEPDLNIWNLVLGSFESLNSRKSPKEITQIIKDFEVGFLSCLGYNLHQIKKDPVDFIYFNLGEKINSKKFLSVVK